MNQSRAKKIRINDDLSNKERAVICLAEFFGTGILVFLGCMSCVHMSLNTHLHISFTFGLAIMIAVQCFGHISGSHINPAVTIAAVVLGHTPLIHFPLYAISQILGGIADFFPFDSQNGICTPTLGAGISPWQGAGVEFILTFILLLVCAALWDCRNTDKHDSLSLRLGFAVAGLVMAGAPFSGSNMNPARTFAPVLLNNTWDNWWVWWIGPMMGGLAAGVLYRYAFSKEEDDREHTPVETLRLNDKA
ncbi:hypothetical protein WA026_000857 [Henosepilachna vigintioctopunctata]|uniref:Uncharacterized protein n=1 Tax=Henosepilachna vigintioctopunctata TaxID=420089 RepID=A0AAW1V9Q5_9CUCU